MYVKDEQEFGKAVREETEHIELEGTLAAHVRRMMKLNTVLWIFCLTALSVVIIGVMQMPLSAGTSGIASLVAGSSAASILGADTAIAAVSIAIAGGGISTLYKFRKYRMKHGKNGGIILYLKK